MKGKAIKLRNIEPQDIDIILEIENDEKNMRLSETLYPYSRYEIEEFVLNAPHDITVNKQLRLMIEENSSGKVAGCVDIFDYNPVHRRAGVGIIIVEEFRRKGYSTETLEIIRDFAFNTLGLHQLYCNVHEDNSESRRLFEKSGYEKTGIKKDWEIFDGKFKDVIFYQLINK